MANISITGLPALAWFVGTVVVGSVPVWFGAKVTGAENPTLIRSATSLIVGLIGSIIGFVIGGPIAILLVPFSFLLSFKFILRMSFLGALMLGIVALFGYFLMAKFIGGGISTTQESNTPHETSVQLEINRPASSRFCGT